MTERSFLGKGFVYGLFSFPQAGRSPTTPENGKCFDDLLAMNEKEFYYTKPLGRAQHSNENKPRTADSGAHNQPFI
jgi:hypothetical protein